MKQSKQPSFWKPDKISLTKPNPSNVLFDYPKSTSNFNPMPTNHKLFGFDTKIYKPKSAFTKSISIFSKGVKAQKNLKVVNTNINLPKKEMNWFQAKSKFPKLNPFKDADRDGVMNMYDCKPFNKSRQGEEIKTKTQIGRSVQKMQEKQDLISNTKKIARAKIPEEVKGITLNFEKKLPSVKRKFKKYIKEMSTKTIDKTVGWKNQRLSKQQPQTVIIMPGAEELSPKMQSYKPVNQLLNELHKVPIKEYGNIGKTKAELSLPIERERTKRALKKFEAKVAGDIEMKKISERNKLIQIRELKEADLKKAAARIANIKGREQIQLKKTEAATTTSEERRTRHSDSNALKMVRYQDSMLRSMSKIAGTGRTRSYKDRWVSGEDLLRKAEKRDKAEMREDAMRPPSMILRTPYTVKMRLREIENELKEKEITPPSPIKKLSQKEPATAPIQTKESGKIIFDMPVKSKARQFVERLVGKTPDVYVAERLRRHKDVALSTITREDYATKEEKKIGEAERKRIEDESPYEKSTEYEGIYKEKRFAKNLVDELNREAKKTSKKETKENKAEQKKEKKEAKQEKVQERQEKKKEHKAEKEIKTDDFGTEYESSAQAVIDEV